MHGSELVMLHHAFTIYLLSTCSFGNAGLVGSAQPGSPWMTPHI